MVRDEAWIIPQSIHAYKEGEPARVVGVEFITPENYPTRLCYHLRWPDQSEDWIPVSDVDGESYKLVSLSELLP